MYSRDIELMESSDFIAEQLELVADAMEELEELNQEDDEEIINE